MTHSRRTTHAQSMQKYLLGCSSYWFLWLFYL